MNIIPTGELIVKTIIRVKNMPSLLFCLFGFFLLFSGNLQAQQEPKLDLKTTIEKEVKVKKQGKWVIETQAVDKTAPGDVLVFTITYTNAGKSPLTDAVVVNPVPKGVAVNPQSAEGKDTEVTGSIDNSRSFHALPVMVKLKKPDGSLESKPAPPESYTHIRWGIKKPVQAGQSGQVSFKATVK